MLSFHGDTAGSTPSLHTFLYMKANTKVKITLGFYRGSTGKVVAKTKLKPALLQGMLAVEIDIADGIKNIVRVPEAIVEKI